MEGGSSTKAIEESELRRAIDSGLDRELLAQLNTLHLRPSVQAVAASQGHGDARSSARALELVLANVLKAGTGRDWEALRDWAGLTPGLTGTVRSVRNDATARRLHPPDGYSDDRSLRRQKQRLINKLHVALDDFEYDRAYLHLLSEGHSSPETPQRQGALAVGGPYRVREIDMLFMFQARSPVKTFEIFTIEAEDAPVSEVRIGYVNEPHQRDLADLEIEILEGGILEEIVPFDGGYHVARIALSQVLQPHGRMRLRFTRSPVAPGTRLERNWFGLHSARPADRATLRLLFQDEQPESVASFRDVPQLAGPGNKEQQTARPVDRYGYTDDVYEAMVAGLSYGLAWTWRE